MRLRSIQQIEQLLSSQNPGLYQDQNSIESQRWFAGEHRIFVHCSIRGPNALRSKQSGQPGTPDTSRISSLLCPGTAICRDRPGADSSKFGICNANDERGPEYTVQLSTQSSMVVSTGNQSEEQALRILCSSDGCRLRTLRLAAHVAANLQHRSHMVLRVVSEWTAERQLPGNLVCRMAEEVVQWRYTGLAYPSVLLARMEQLYLHLRLRRRLWILDKSRTLRWNGNVHAILLGHICGNPEIKLAQRL